MNPIKRRRPRYQSGSLLERSGSFYVRYYQRDTKGKPARKVEFLCEKDEKRHSMTAKPVLKLLADFMRKVNSDSRPQQEVLVTDFWTDTYLPFIQANRRPSTVDGYRQLWEGQLKAHFANYSLQDYRTHHASNFLTGLTGKYGKRSLSHLRSLGSGIFSLAVNKGLIERNPFHDVQILAKVKQPAIQLHYTMEEEIAILNALAGKLDCQLIMALAFFAGLRNSEIRGLKWEDFTDGQVHIQRGFVRKYLSDLKTESSNRVVPLIPHVRLLLDLWHKKSGKPKVGWLFPNRKGTRPINLRDVARNYIKPILDEANLQWKGYHAGRHGFGTKLTELTGNLIAAQEGLGHSNQIVTGMFYDMKKPKALEAGMEQLGEATEKALSSAQEPQKQQLAPRGFTTA
jgi:integrase